MKRALLLAATSLALALTSMAHAATMTVSVDGLSNVSEIHGVTVWFEVGPNFSFSDFAPGNAVPPAKSAMGWQQDTPRVDGSLFKMGNSDWDFLIAGLSNPLKDGILATFNYTGTITGVNLSQFGDAAGTDITAVVLRKFDATTAQFSAAPVPVPGAAILLGSGLLGLLGYRRKVTGK